MSYRHTLEAALESLQDIEELIKGFPDSGDVPSIELDLSLQKLRNIYELLLILKKPVDLSIDQHSAASSVPVTAQDTAPVTTPATAPVSAPVTTKVSSGLSSQITTPDPVPVSTPVSSPVSVDNSIQPSAPVPAPPTVQARETVTEIHVEKEITEAVRKPAPEVVPPRQQATSPKETSEAQILSDRFKGRATLHETLHQNLGKDGQYHSQGKPVENLMTAIAINDRFTFIRELFNGDSPAFEHAIRVLNEASNFNDAYNYMIQNYDWDMDSEAVQLLLDIIRRKYIISRHE